MKKEESKAVLFVNWTEEDFTWKFDGDDYTIKAGQSTYFKKPIAELFAKHLVDRELNKSKLPTSDHSRPELLKRCFGEEFTASSEEKIEGKVLDMNEKAEEIEKKSVSDEESFEGLKQNETVDAK